MSFRSLARLASIALLAISAFAADVTGKWKTSFTMQNGNTREGVMTLKAEGDKLTGTMEGGRGGAASISDGKISGDDISFAVTRNFNGNEVKINYKGRVSGNSMRLTMEFNGQEMNMTATKTE